MVLITAEEFVDAMIYWHDNKKDDVWKALSEDKVVISLREYESLTNAEYILNQLNELEKENLL